MECKLGGSGVRGDWLRAHRREGQHDQQPRVEFAQLRSATSEHCSSSLTLRGVPEIDGKK